MGTTLFIALALALAGCGSEPDPNISVSGELVRGAGPSLPPESSARISMFEHRDGGGDKRIVAERSLHQVQGKEIKFDLEIARNLIKPNEEYGLRAEVMAPEGDVLWQTSQPLRFKPLERSEGVKLELVEARQEAEMAFRKYRCEDGFHLSAVTNDDRAIVRLGNRRLVLPADSGEATFTDEHDNQLKLNAGKSIGFRVDGSEHAQCHPVTDQTPPQNQGDGESAAGDDEAEQTEPGEQKEGGSGSSDEGDKVAEADREPGETSANAPEKPESENNSQDGAGTSE